MGVYLTVCKWSYAYSAHEDQKRAPDPLELSLADGY